MIMYTMSIDVNEDEKEVSFSGADYGDGISQVTVSMVQLPIIINELDRILKEHANV